MQHERQLPRCNTGIVRFQSYISGMTAEPQPDDVSICKTAGRRREALLILNPRARNGAGDATAIRAELEQGGFLLREKQPDRDTSISDLIRQNSDCDLVIIGGGDGSLNAALHGLIDTGLPLAILPLGTANDFARTIGLPATPMQAAEALSGYQAQPVDLGQVNDHLFLNVASIGFSAELASQLSAEAKKRWGKLGYAIAAFRILMRSQLFSAELEHDGMVEKIRTLQVSVGNGKFYGGGMAVEQHATVQDQRLDFYSLEVDHWWRLLRLLPSLRRGTQGQWDDVRAFPTREVIIRTRVPRPVNTDGELVTYTPAHFKLLPAAIRVFMPE